MRNRLARRVVKSRVAWVIILTMFLNTFSIQAAYAAGEIAVPEETAALEEAEEPAVEKEEGETEGKTRLAANYTGDAAWLNDWDGGTPTLSGDYVILSKYTHNPASVNPSENLIIPATVSINNKGYSVKLSENSSSMFSGHSEIKTISFNEGVDTSAVKSVENMFYNCSKLENFDFTNFNTSNLADVSQMFYNCSKLESFDFTNFNTSNLTDVSQMFYNCSNLTSVDLSNVNISKVTNMQEMFFGCNKLTSLDFTNMNTDKVTNMKGVFRDCQNLECLDLTSISTNNVTNMSFMFYGCQKLKNLDVSDFNTSSVTDMSYMFYGCQNLTSLNVSGFDTSSVRNVVNMFCGCSSLTHLELQNFNMVSVNAVDGFLLNMSGLEKIETPTNLTTDVVLPGDFFDESAWPGQKYSTLPMNEAVSKTYIKYISVNGISVSPDKLLLAIGENVTLSADVVPKNATEKDLTYTWSSVDPGVATVDDSGKVTGVANGKTTIKVSANNMEASCTVSVNGEFVPVESVTVTASTNHIKVGEKTGLSANVLPVNATNKNVTWSSDKENIATVDDHGIVTGVAEGTATITAESQNGKKGTCDITVSANIVDTAWQEDWYYDLDKDSGTIILSKYKPTSVSTPDLEVPDYARVGGVSYNKVRFSKDASEMFKGHTELKTLDLKNVDTSDVTSMRGIFENCSGLTSVDLTKFDTGKVTNMADMFSECSSLTNLDLDSFDTNKVEFMSQMFKDCSSLTSLDLSGFDTGEVTSMNMMFSKCKSLISLNLEGVKTGGVRSMHCMFMDCESLPSVDLSGFDTGNVNMMSFMFSGCRSLTSLDIKTLNAGKVSDLQYMFSGCRSLITLDLKGLNTSKASNMDYMFMGCKNLKSINPKELDTSNVHTMQGMFSYCSSLESLDLEGFNTARVSNMDYMFQGCSALKSINMKGITADKVQKMSLMFQNCRSLKSIDLSGFDMVSVNQATRCLEGMTSLNIIETPKNVKLSVSLPYVFVEKDVVPFVEYEELPKNTGTSKTLVRSVDVKSISLDRMELTIDINESYPLSANTVPANAPVIWSSDHEEFATVDADGRVTGRAEGTAIITAETLNHKTATCTVTVTNHSFIPVTGISVDPAIKTIRVNESATITATVSPANATDKTVIWESSRPEIASVGTTGRVKGLSPGTAAITATTKDGGFIAVCTVIVRKAGLSDESGLDPRLFYSLDTKGETSHTYKAEIVRGQKYQLGSGSWTSSAPKTVGVNKKSGAVKAKKGGTSKLVNNAGDTVYYMTVLEPELTVKTRTVFVGSTVSVSIRNTGNLPVSWVSGDIHKASVEKDDDDDNRAVITGVGKGKTRVYAYVNGRAYPVTVNVTDRAASKSLKSYDSIRINAYQTYALKYNNGLFKPSKVVSWSDMAGLSWARNSKGNWVDHTQAVTITKAGKVIGKTSADNNPVIAKGTDKDGNTVTLEITVDAIPVKTDVYMNVGQTASLKHSYVKNSDRVRWIYDNKNINLSNADKVKTRIKALAAGEGTATCRYQDMEYYTYVHVEDPEVITEGGMKRTKPSAYNYTLSLKKGDSFDIGMSGVYQDVLWRSNKQGVAFVDEYGRISARGRGKATLSTRVNNRKLKINVTVE